MFKEQNAIHGYSPKTLIRVTGEDSFSFLQGQFTNELRQASGSATYGLWLNQKGKVVADSVVLRLAENEFLLVSVSSPAAVIMQRLQDYIVADDVILTDETAPAGALILWGAGSGQAVRQMFGGLPAAGQFLRDSDTLVFPGGRLGGENYEIIGPEENISGRSAQLVADGFTRNGVVEMERKRIQAGVPAVPQDLGPTDLPNEGGLETTAISYTKGCYLGQEVMARLKNLGQVRRKLHVVQGAGPLPQPLTPLFQGPKKIGELRSVAGSEQGYVAFAMLSLINFNSTEGLGFAPDALPSVWLHPHE